MKAATQAVSRTRKSVLVKKEKKRKPNKLKFSRLKTCRLRLRRRKAQTQLEKRRVRTAKVSLLVMTLFFGVVALTSVIEDIPSESSLPSFVEILTETELAAASESQELSPVSLVDPLKIEQVGIELKKQNDAGTILWYESTCSADQSRVFICNALTAAGWEQTSSVTDQALSFVHPSNSNAPTKSLFVSFYNSNKGCSILAEIL